MVSSRIGLLGLATSKVLRYWEKPYDLYQATLPAICVDLHSRSRCDCARSSQPSPLITQKVNNAALVKLDGNTRPEVTAAKDLGPVDDSMSLNGLQIVMQRS
jgi:hypothetical protein